MIIQFSKSKNKKPKNKTVKLVKHVTPKVNSCFTYVDIDGQEKIYVGEYTKTNNTYFFTKHLKHKNVVDCEVKNVIEHVNPYFTYMDKDGYERTFNRLDSLEYADGSYFGDIEEIEYVNHEIEIFEEK